MFCFMVCFFLFNILVTLGFFRYSSTSKFHSAIKTVYIYRILSLKEFNEAQFTLKNYTQFMLKVLYVTVHKNFSGKC